MLTVNGREFVLPIIESGREPLGRVCVEAVKERRALVGEMGELSSDEGSVCVFDITCERVVDGVSRDEAVSGVSIAVGEDGTRRAGFGNVLNVEPNDVYLKEVGG
jgi:hypothetical protein